jgi:hypothetical protein
MRLFFRHTPLRLLLKVSTWLQILAVPFIFFGGKVLRNAFLRLYWSEGEYSTFTSSWLSKPVGTDTTLC